MKTRTSSIDYNAEQDMFHEIMSNSNILKEIRKNIHINDTILEELEQASNESDTGVLSNKVIQVGEFSNP